jgi:pyruvate,water dikinase
MLLELLEQGSIEQWLESSKKTWLKQQLSQLIRQFVVAFAPRPVFYRSTDGLLLKERGTYNYCLNPSLFELELEALSQVMNQGYSNLNLILPFVRSVREFNFCREKIEAVGLNKYPSFQLWIMAEVPSVLFLLPEYVKAGVQGISIGTNDLTELLLGVNRDQPNSSPELNATHPAMLAVLEKLIKTAKSIGIPCSICGQAPVQYPQLIDKLVEWGITSISVEPEAIINSYNAIARAEISLLLETVRK